MHWSRSDLIISSSARVSFLQRRGDITFASGHGKSVPSTSGVFELVLGAEWDDAKCRLAEGSSLHTLNKFN